MKKQAIIIHGWESNPTEHWFPWLKFELEKKDFEVSTPAMPDTFFPKQNQWVQYLQEIAGAVDKDTFLIGHSLGVITILRFLEQLTENEKIGGAILVAGFSESLAVVPEIENFFTDTVDYKKTKEHCEKFIIINSDNDPWVPLKSGKIMQRELGGKFMILHNCGHFSLGTGDNKFPGLVDELLKISKNQI